MIFLNRVAVSSVSGSATTVKATNTIHPRFDLISETSCRVGAGCLVMTRYNGRKTAMIARMLSAKTTNG